jgi:hypothetical protein
MRKAFPRNPYSRRSCSDSAFPESVKKWVCRSLSERVWILVDATYQPINELSESARELVIAQDYPLLREDLTTLLPDRSIPIILIKVNVGRILEPKLANDGFNVINRGSPIYFPSSGQQNRFKQQFASIMETAGLVS